MKKSKNKKPDRKEAKYQRLIADGLRQELLFVTETLVYHYDKTGNKEILDFKSNPRENKESALDEASEWCDEHEIDAEMID